MPKPERVSKSVTIRKDLADRLDKEAEDRLVSPAFIVEKALDRFFEQLAAPGPVAFPATTPAEQ